MLGLGGRKHCLGSRLVREGANTTCSRRANRTAARGQVQIPMLGKDKLNRQRPEGRWRSASSEGRSMYFSLGDIIVRLIYSSDCLGMSSYPMPVTRVRKLMDELVSS